MTEEFINEDKAQPHTQYPSATDNREQHQKILREMDMVQWDKLSAELDVVYSNGRVRIAGQEFIKPLTETLRTLGYEYQESRVVVRDYEITHFVFFEKISDSWR